VVTQGRVVMPESVVMQGRVVMQGSGNAGKSYLLLCAFQYRKMDMIVEEDIRAVLRVC